MSKDSKLPNPYRCLRGAGVSVAALVMLACLFALEMAVCAAFGRASMLCTALSAPYEWWLGAVAAGGIAYTLYAAHRDFFRGRYYSDLAKMQQRY
jgi:hypothetical protein